MQPESNKSGLKKSHRQNAQTNADLIVPINLNINITQFVNFRVLDGFMRHYHQTAYKKQFMEVYQKKQRILQAVNSKKLPVAMYMQLSKKVLNQSQNEQLKKTIKIDMEMIDDLHEGNIDKWFQQNVKDTISACNQQKDIYQKHKKGVIVHKIQDDQQLDTSNLTEQSTAQVNPSQCLSFGTLDKYLSKNDQNPDIFIILYQKKQKMLDLVSKKQLNSQKYQQILKNGLKITQNQKLKFLYQSDLENIKDIYEGNIQEWWQSIIDQTKSNLILQDEKYQELKQWAKKNPKKAVKNNNIQSLELIKEKKSKQQNNKKKQLKLPFQVQRMYNVKIIDNSLLEHGDNDQAFIKLFEQKQKLVMLLSTGKLDAKSYKALQSKSMKQFQNNEQIKGQIQFDLMAIDDDHNGDVNAWFQETVQGASLQYQDQKARYDELIESKKQPQIHPVEKTKIKVQKMDEQHHSDELGIQKINSLKALDNMILMQDDDAVFIKLFTQKRKLVDQIKNGSLKAEKYKTMVENVVTQFCNNDDVKGQAQMELMELQNTHNNNIKAWFNQIVDSSNQQFQNQLAKYDEIKSTKKDASSSIASSKTNQKGSLQNEVKKVITQPPTANQLLCFTAIQEGFKEFSSNSDVKNLLNEKRDKFIDWVNTGKMTAQKYIAMCQKIYDSTANSWLKAQMQKQHMKLMNQFKEDKQKWFKQVVKVLKEKPKNAFENRVSEAEGIVNQSSPNSKIRFFLEEMSRYESLAKFYKTNNMDPKKNQLLKIYLTVPRKDIEQTIQRIKTDKQFDVVLYCKKLLPEINQSVIHQDVQVYKQKLSEYIRSYNGLIESLKQYGKKLKKSVNSLNFEKIKKKTQECQSNMKYLMQLMNNPKKLIPLPLVEEQIVNYYNMDEFTNLEHGEIELKIVEIQNMSEQHIIKIYFLQDKIKQQHVKNGPNNITSKAKAPQTQFNKIMKEQIKCFKIALLKKGWFSNTQVGRESLQNKFIGSNISTGKIEIQGIQIVYQMRVKMARRPIITQIKQYKMTKYPPYQHSKQVSKQFVSKYAPSKK